MKIESFVDPYLKRTWAELGARVLTSGQQVAVTLGYPAAGMQAELEQQLAQFLGTSNIELELSFQAPTGAGFGQVKHIIAVASGKGGVGKINFPLVSDYTKKVAQGYDVIMNDTFAMRATFVLDSNGYIRHQSINDFPIGRNIEEIIRIVDAIDFNIETNNLCPANWKKGKKGISTDDEFAREFLKA